MPKTAAIVLAAGYSSRMGGAFKPLLAIAGHTAAWHAVQAHIRAGVSDIHAVAGHRADEVTEAVRRLGVRVVYNPRFEQGMFSSVQAGVASLDRDVEAFFIHPVDIPLVSPSTIRALIEAFGQNPGGVLHPVFRGRRGHPPLIPAGYADDILASPAPDGLRGLLKGHDAGARCVEVYDEAILLDMDTVQDYRRILAYAQGADIPGQEQCLRLLEAAGAPERVQGHCLRVHAVARRLARRLNVSGAGLDEKLVAAGALLHDVKRHEKDHARAGALYLMDQGHARVAGIVAAHMDIAAPDGPIPTEAEIVFLADKLVMGAGRAPLEERFAAAEKTHGQDAQARQAIGRRREQAGKIKKKVETILGCALEDILPDTVL